MSKKFYFFKSEEVNGKIRINAIPNQVDETGAAIDTTLNVSCAKDLRESNPVGTLFVSDAITKTSKSGSSVFYYTVKNFRIYNSISEPETEVEYRKICPISVIESIIMDPMLKAPESKVDGFFVSQDDWNILVRNIKKHVNTLIIGPTGSGKTSVVKELCNRLNLPLHIFDMGSIIDPISSLLGVHRLEDGKSIFDYANFTKVIQEPGVILLDELSRASLASNNILFPCLDDRRKLQIEVAGSKDIREINVHPECTFIATANVGAEYTGTNSMDKALVNRFFPLEVNYIPANEEISVLMKRTEISEDDAKLIVKITNNIRSLAAKQEISSSLSIRETLMVADLVHDGWDLGKAMEMIYLPLFEGTKDENERSTVYKTISSY